MMQIGRQIILLSLVAFVLHIIWENAQAPLFQGYPSFIQHLPICFIGAMGDVALTLSVYVIVSLFKNNFGWPTALNKKDGIALAIVGFFIAVEIERSALLFEKWAYTDAMPIIPYFNIGFMPVLQMSFLLPFSIFLTKKIILAYKNKGGHARIVGMIADTPK